MRSREALRELQDRLALRLQSGRDENTQARWLAVRSGGGRYLLPLGQAGEIFPVLPAHPVPYTQPWFLGVVHLRGGLWAAVDLGGFVADAVSALEAEGTLPASGAPSGAVPASRPSPAGGALAAEAQARLVTLHPQLDVNGVLRVDRLAGLRGPEDFLASSPAPAHAPAWFADRHTDARGDSWQAISLLALARDARFLTLGD